ncbi:uncharacterized protein K452DRAFT_334472 [Aplosporella prunicola CBS 121167]|uniref:Uncharacterized protein n=1 Tax=Aplosporella prunicola CBS 121167 TaxID=1176127 RepID=A0A6A6B9T0_9PEZI|nr:uncharacterized protein K452DRAFT_334472 [Aplosporella prunicola CBS 121167]KAF2140959.1 hypothetical protein K452DRAFT_334472 [Aplosporella prunicola CBS 121167]
MVRSAPSQLVSAHVLKTNMYYGYSYPVDVGEVPSSISDLGDASHLREYLERHAGSSVLSSTMSDSGDASHLGYFWESLRRIIGVSPIQSSTGSGPDLQGPVPTAESSDVSNSESSLEGAASESNPESDSGSSIPQPLKSEVEAEKEEKQEDDKQEDDKQEEDTQGPLSQENSEQEVEVEEDTSETPQSEILYSHTYHNFCGIVEILPADQAYAAAMAEYTPAAWSRMPFWISRCKSTVGVAWKDACPADNRNVNNGPALTWHSTTTHVQQKVEESSLVMLKAVEIAARLVRVQCLARFAEGTILRPDMAPIPDLGYGTAWRPKTCVIYTDCKETVLGMKEFSWGNIQHSRHGNHICKIRGLIDKIKSLGVNVKICWVDPAWSVEGLKNAANVAKRLAEDNTRAPPPLDEDVLEPRYTIMNVRQFKGQ